MKTTKMLSNHISHFINLLNIRYLQQLYYINMKKLGKTYEYNRQFCESFVSKIQVCKLKVQQMRPICDDTIGTINPIGGNPNSQQNFYSGRLYKTSHSKYCFYSFPLNSIEGYQTELNGEQMCESKEPNFCRLLGPYTVESKDRNIGQLRPKCYSWRYFAFLSYLCLPYCTSLDVHDAEKRHIYTIKRIPWSCFKWQVFNSLQELQSQIIAPCCAPLEFNLPIDSEDNKKLLMSALPYLP